MTSDGSLVRFGEGDPRKPEDGGFVGKSVACAFELGKRRGRTPKPHTLSAAAIAPPPVWLSREDQNELLALAKKIDRLTISRIDPEKFFADRSELADAIRRIARRP